MQHKVTIEDERLTVIAGVAAGSRCVIDTVKSWPRARLLLREANMSVQLVQRANKESGINTQRVRDGTSPAHSKIT